MNDYDTRILIAELQKLVVDKQKTINVQEYQIKQLKEEIERLEHLLTPKVETK